MNLSASSRAAGWVERRRTSRSAVSFLRSPEYTTNREIGANLQHSVPDHGPARVIHRVRCRYAPRRRCRRRRPPLPCPFSQPEEVRRVLPAARLSIGWLTRLSRTMSASRGTISRPAQTKAAPTVGSTRARRETGAGSVLIWTTAGSGCCTGNKEGSTACGCTIREIAWVGQAPMHARQSRQREASTSALSSTR